MEEVVIGFPDLKSLLAFKDAINARVFEISDIHFTLVCNCSQADIELAKSKYDGFLLSQGNKP